LRVGFLLNEKVRKKFGIFPNIVLPLQCILMIVIGRKILLKLQKKNIGNRRLCSEIDHLLSDLEGYSPENGSIFNYRRDADLVHADGFYFFDIHIHRTLVLVELEEDGVATIIWAGTHLEYESIFRNNKSTVEKWLRKNKYIR
jgi:hypothetical protein